MANLQEVDVSTLVAEVANKLKGVIAKPPEYINYAKSGADKERVPQDKAFWYVRSASVLRQVYMNGPVGVQRLRVRYGGRKGHTMHRGHHTNAGGSIIQDSLKALEAAGFVKTTKKGREITPKGRSFLDTAKNEILVKK